jgi:hypothetical protein
MTFALDLQRFAEKTRGKADEAVGAVVIGIASRLDERSPVGDGSYWITPPPAGYVGGHFRGNWQLGVGTIPAGEIAGADPTGERTLGRITAAVPGEAAGKVYWIANNAKYARRLEDGWSRQAPQGLVGLTVIEFQQIVRQAVERVQ